MVKIEKIGVSSSAKIYGLTMGIFGLIIGIFYALFFSAFSGLLGDDLPTGTGGLGFLMIIGFPVFYGILGFISGALGAVIYNFIASKVGGLEIQLSSENSLPPQ